MLNTKDLYMKACLQSNELHALTDDERCRLQAHLRKMYLEIEKVCNRHGLRMCLGCGNVLGALRHQGFIPWDDDLDLLMPRDDYDKLINEYANELPESYKIFSPNSVHIYRRILQRKDVYKNTFFFAVFSSRFKKSCCSIYDFTKSIFRTIYRVR